jgi:hypothetical protein
MSNLLLRLDFTLVKIFGVATSDYKVINIEKKYYEMVIHFLGIEIGVKMTSREAIVKNKVIYFSIASARSSVKAIKRFLKVENKNRIILNIS